jgi:hypothetical protein
MISVVRIEPTENAFQISVTADGKLWRKKYRSMQTATVEAISLGMISNSDKLVLDNSECYPIDPSRPLPRLPRALEGKADVDIAELITLGFRESHQ